MMSRRRLERRVSGGMGAGRLAAREGVHLDQPDGERDALLYTKIQE
jgi:hypothetical protein